jgi:hypothetical protein
MGDARFDEGDGGHRQTLTPSPQTEITIETPITRAPTHLLESPKLAAGSQPRAPPSRAPPPHAHPSPPAHVCLQHDIRVFIWSPLWSTLLTTYNKVNLFSSQKNLYCLYSLYVCIVGLLLIIITKRRSCPLWLSLYLRLSERYGEIIKWRYNC